MQTTAVRAALAAGRIQREHYGTLLKVDATKRNDIKLEVDRLCEDAIRDEIRTAHPAHALLAEESGSTQGADAYRWIVDPLDGTVNFFYGIPYFCTCVACYRRPVGRAHAPEGRGREERASGAGPAEALGEPVVGVV